jgi:hypothetical protein
MIGALTSTLLRQIPDAARMGLATGDLKVFGSVIRSVADGRIRYHLQETSGLASLLKAGVPALDPVSLLMQGVTVAQNEQIKSALSVVQSLQFGSLVLGAANLGVSVAGTALVLSRIKVLEQKIDALAPQLEIIARGVEALRQDRIAEDFTRLRTLGDQLDECWLLDDAAREWSAIARDAHLLSDSFTRRALEAGPVAGDPFATAFAIASSVRVTARLAAGEDEAARRAASQRAETMIDLGRGLQLAPLTLEAMRGKAEIGGSRQWQEKYEATAANLQPLVGAARERELSAATSLTTLEALAERDIRGRQWLEAARQEVDVPLLILPAPGT